jgi:hypothetical protein
VDPYIGVHHADQGHPREIQAFGDHLGSEEDIEFPSAKTPKDLMVGPLPGGCVHVHPGNSSVGEGLRHDPFHLFGPEPPETQVFPSAAVTPPWARFIMPTVVAEESSGHTVVGKGY